MGSGWKYFIITCMPREEFLSKSSFSRSCRIHNHANVWFQTRLYSDTRPGTKLSAEFILPNIHNANVRLSPMPRCRNFTMNEQCVRVVFPCTYMDNMLSSQSAFRITVSVQLIDKNLWVAYPVWRGFICSEISVNNPIRCESDSFWGGNGNNNIIRT